MSAQQSGQGSLATIARKELRAYFLTPVALIFLAMFLVATVLSFFTVSGFFARNLADVRPLFQNLPVLLIFLVAAVTMRQWSEEQKMGTLEILLTLPVKTHHLVLGKFAAGMALVGIALALTLPLPITVSSLGALDWGPVIGGYVGALLLAAAYMAIGLCVSARTDNQIVALMMTATICGVLYGIGHPQLVKFFSVEGSEILRAIGSGSRFASIERGVLDIRDLFYYLSLTAFFLVLNIHFLEMKRLDVHTDTGRQHAMTRWLTVGLAALNVMVGNVWLAPVTATRADLTADGDYSVSDVTENMLAGLDENLTISGYFSEKTHPLLAPLVPRLRDFLAEYEIRGRGNVKVEFIDPNKDPELQEEIGEQFDIKSVPFRISARNEESVVNAYFHVLIRYGDQYEVLSFNDIIEIHADDSGDVDIRLRNIEYDITRAIKKTTQGFQSIEAVFARLDSAAKLTFYVTEDKLPPDMKEAPVRIRAVAEELVEKSGGKLAFDEQTPPLDEGTQNRLWQQYGVRPMAADLFGQERYYLALSLEVGDRREPIYMQGDTTEAAARSTIEAAVKRATPGFLRTIGLYTHQPEAPQANPMMPSQFQPPPPQPDYRLLEQMLAEDFTVQRIDNLESGYVPSSVDVLVVAKPGKVDEKAQFAIDQFLMRGGAVIALTGDHSIKAERTGLVTQDIDDAVKAMLDSYGVEIVDGFVMDAANARFPMPIQERRGGFVMQRVAMVDYPYFPDIRPGSFNRGHVAVAGLPNVVLNWASPLKLKESTKSDAVDAQVVLSSSEQSWVTASTQLLPESVEAADSAFQPEGDQMAHPVAVTLHGRFSSYFGDKPSPVWGEDAAEAGEGGEVDRTGRTLKESTPDARLAVVGSSAFASDLIARLGDQIGGGVYRSNFQFVRNLVDWALADTDLLSIRSAGAFARTLKPMDDKERLTWELINYAVVLLAMGFVVFVASSRRRNAQPIPLKGGQS